MTYSVIDLFAGCGGLSRGLASTGLFSTDIAVELEPHAAGTFVANLTGRDGEPTSMHFGDIHELIDDRRKFRKFLAQRELDKAGTLDLLAGGPPCQGFSRNGVREYEESGVRFYDRPINHLYKAFLEVLEITMPRVVMIENVREFLKAANGHFRDDLFSRLRELGYRAEARIVCAADYGVPKMRYRMIILASRDGINIHWPQSTHSSTGGEDLFTQPYHTVSDAFSDLPAPTYSHDDPPLQYPRRTKISEYAQSMRSRSGVVANHVARNLSAGSLAKVRAVGTGRMRDIDPKMQTKSFYGSAYGRLAWDEPSLTVTTWVYHVGSGRYAHPTEDRAITMREAARLQSFDDEFVFPPLINPVSRMIGNAVPPLLGKAFGAVIGNALNEADQAASKRSVAS